MEVVAEEYWRDAVDTYFLTLNLEYSVNDTYELTEDESGYDFNLKSRLGLDFLHFNDNARRLLYIDLDGINIMVYKPWLARVDYLDIVFSCKGHKTLSDGIMKFHFKNVENAVEGIEILKLFNNYILFLMEEFKII